METKRKNYSGTFICFEGSEGCGKSTQINLLYNELIKEGWDCIITREPGGTEIGEYLRGLLKNESLNNSISYKTEALLIQAARAQHTDELIRPSLEAGKIVLCDRFSDSSIAYQGFGRNLGENTINYFNEFSTSGIYPDINFILDIPVEEGLKRVTNRLNSKNDRFEIENLEFHKTIRNSFLYLANKSPEKYKILDATQTIEKLKNEIKSVISNEFGIL